MRIEIAPPQLNIKPELVRCGSIVIVLRVVKKAWLRHWPFVRSEQHKVGTTAIHLVRLSRMNRLLLDTFNFQRIQLLIEHLHNIHNDTFMNLLPQMSSENLDKRYLERWDFSMHEDSRQI
jgi:hypothetical protein